MNLKINAFRAFNLSKLVLKYVLCAFCVRFGNKKNLNILRVWFCGVREVNCVVLKYLQNCKYNRLFLQARFLKTTKSVQASLTDFLCFHSQRSCECCGVREINFVVHFSSNPVNAAFCAFSPSTFKQQSPIK